MIETSLQTIRAAVVSRRDALLAEVAKLDKALADLDALPALLATEAEEVEAAPPPRSAPKTAQPVARSGGGSERLLEAIKALGPGASNGSLAQAAQLSTVSVSLLLKKLETAGRIRREGGKFNRRIHLLDVGSEEPQVVGLNDRHPVVADPKPTVFASPPAAKPKEQPRDSWPKQRRCSECTTVFLSHSIDDGVCASCLKRDGAGARARFELAFLQGHHVRVDRTAKGEETWVIDSRSHSRAEALDRANESRRKRGASSLSDDQAAE